MAGRPTVVAADGRRAGRVPEGRRRHGEPASSARGATCRSCFSSASSRRFCPRPSTREPRPIALPYDFPALEQHVEMHESFGVIIIDSLADFCRTPRQVAETLVLLEDLASRANVALIVTLPANCRDRRPGPAAGDVALAHRQSALGVVRGSRPGRSLAAAVRGQTDELLPRAGRPGVSASATAAWPGRPQSRISPVDPLGQWSASELCLQELLADRRPSRLDGVSTGGRAGVHAEGVAGRRQAAGGDYHADRVFGQGTLELVAAGPDGKRTWRGRGGRAVGVLSLAGDGCGC